MINNSAVVLVIDGWVTITTRYANGGGLTVLGREGAYYDKCKRPHPLQHI